MDHLHPAVLSALLLGLAGVCAKLIGVFFGGAKEIASDKARALEQAAEKAARALESAAAKTEAATLKSEEILRASMIKSETELRAAGLKSETDLRGQLDALAGRQETSINTLGTRLEKAFDLVAGDVKSLFREQAEQAKILAPVPRAIEELASRMGRMELGISEWKTEETRAHMEISTIAAALTARLNTTDKRLDALELGAARPKTAPR